MTDETAVQSAPEETPNMRYDEARQWLLVKGLIAHQLPTHVLAPRPKRNSRAVAFDELAGNTTIGVHLSEIAAGGEKVGHRHVDEAVIYIVSGRGWSELRQDDGNPMQRIEWKPGDLLSIPSNAWHQHFNSSPDEVSRQLAFKNTQLLRKLFGSREFVYANDFRFSDRYADQDDYWTSRSQTEAGEVVTNVLVNCANEKLPEAADLGPGVSFQRYRMGGHKMLMVELVDLAPGAHLRPSHPLAEEAIYILAGSGSTQVWSENSDEAIIDWTTGDLICPPFDTWRQHKAGEEGARALLVRNEFLSLALKSDRLPVRFP